MRQSFVILFSIFNMTVGLQSQPATELHPFGLEGKCVGLLSTSPTLFFPYLYATTVEGVFQRDLSNPESSWVNLGLEGKYITAIDIQVWSVGPTTFQTPIVVVSTSSATGDSIPIYRLEDRAWIPAYSGITDGISALASFASSEHEPPGSAFAAGISGFLFRSNTPSTGWTEIYSSSIGPGFTVLTAHQIHTLKEIWVGGFDSHSYLALVGKLNENGEWLPTGPFPRTSIESVCNAFAFHPTDSQRVYAAVSGAVLCTNDGGVNWQFTGLRDEQTEYYSLCSDHFTPGHLFVVGASRSDGLSKFWESRDDGESWHEVQDVSALSPRGMRLLADPKMASVIYIATVDKGVWKYQSQTVSVASREGKFSLSDYLLVQNYPNPFSTKTCISLNLLKEVPVKIQVFNAAGQEVRLLHEDILTVGVHNFYWDGRDHLGQCVSNGVYFYRLETALGTTTRKTLLLRAK
jgi:hypothetical protein